MTFFQVGKRYNKAVGISCALTMILPLILITFATDGVNSNYYGGINLVILGLAVLMPWTLRETLIVCIIAYLMYAAACLFHHQNAAWLFLQGSFHINSFFLITTGFICVVSSHFTSRARFQDFVLRHELNIRNEELMELDNLKSQFFANVSHELRTPLTLILSPVEKLLANRKALPDKVHETIVLVQKNALRLLKLINEILDIMRLEEKDYEISKRPVDLSKMIPGIVDSVRHLGGTKDLAIRSQGDTQPLMVEGDPYRLEKVLLNLLSNAIKFTPKGGTITVRLQGNHTTAVVEVEDTGIGISSKELPYIFDRFRQAESASKGGRQGVGLGLALARDLAEKHGGTLSVSSEPGKGTTFRLELPLYQGRIPERQRETSLPESRDRLEEPFASAFHAADRMFGAGGGEGDETLPIVGKGDYTVLVVDDEPDMRRYLVSILAEEYRVLQADTGEKGLDLISFHAPDLLLLDWMLPGMDGLEICKILRDDKKTRSLKIILLTARVDETSKIKALKQGADDFLTKPFSAVEVKTRIANQLRTATLQNNLRKQNIELENALNRLKETESQLVQSEKMRGLGNLAAGLLHEINNPLNYTITAIEIARQASPPQVGEDLKETLDDIDEGMRRIRDIVTDLRAFANPEYEGKKEDFRLNDALDSALKLASHELEGVSVIQKIDDECVVLGNRAQLTHLFLNLLVNSAKATRGISPKCTPEIKVWWKEANGRVEISLRDNGVGIQENNLSKIFDPFFTTRAVGEGMGLGLSICHTIVANHGGTIRAESKEGEWTRISFDLPFGRIGSEATGNPIADKAFRVSETKRQG